MNTREWISQRVSRLRAPAPAVVRSTQERLKARLRQGEEAMSPRALRHKLDELKAIVDPLVSEVEGGDAHAGWTGAGASPRTGATSAARERTLRGRLLQVAGPRAYLPPGIA
jgi:hypothetical protein